MWPGRSRTWPSASHGSATGWAGPASWAPTRTASSSCGSCAARASGCTTVTDAARGTGVMFLEQRTADVTRAFYYRAGSAGSTLSRDDVDAAFRDGTRVLHLTGITAALSRQARRAVEYAAAPRRRRRAGRFPRRQLPQQALVPGRGPRRAHPAGPARQHPDRLRRRARTSSAPGAPRTGAGAGRADGAERPRPPTGEARRRSGARRVTPAPGSGHAGGACPSPASTPWAPVMPSPPATSPALLDGEDVAGRLHRAVHPAGAFAVSTAGDWEGLPRRAELALLGTTPSGTTQR